MATAAGAEFDSVYNFNENTSAYTNNTLEAQSPAGTSFTLFNSTDDYLLIGHASKFDMAVFDIDTAGSLGALTWQYSTANAWVTFQPASGRYQIDPDDNQGGQFDFSKDGVEIFPPNLMSDWATRAFTIDGASVSKYWLRVSVASTATAPTIKRIQMRPYSSYCTTKDVFELLQLRNILIPAGSAYGTDFTADSVPSISTVEQYILEAQSYIDMFTRKSWRPNYIANEYQPFNINGTKLDKPDPYKILDVQIWNGADWETKTQGRKQDYFLVPDTGMMHFSRFFILPVRFAASNAPLWRWGGGEFLHPVKITYLAGRDVQTDVRQGGVITDIAKKLAAIDVVRSSDFGQTVVSGMDKINLETKISGWTEEIKDNLDAMKAFEVF